MPKKLNRKAILWASLSALVLIIIALAAVIIFLLNNSSDETQAANKQTDETQISTPESTEVKTDSDDWVMFNLNEKMVFATQEMQVNSSRLATYIKESSAYSTPEYAGEGAQFLIINMTIKNTTNQPFSFRAMSLINQDGDQYEEYSGIGSVDDYLTGRELAPNIPETGNVVFRVSSDSTSFKLFGQNSSTGEVYAVDLNP